MTTNDHANIVLEWDIADGGILGAVIVCETCSGNGTAEGASCETCSGAGELHRPYALPGAPDRTLSIGLDGTVAPSPGCVTPPGENAPNADAHTDADPADQPISILVSWLDRYLYAKTGRTLESAAAHTPLLLPGAISTLAVRASTDIAAGVALRLFNAALVAGLDQLILDEAHPRLDAMPPSAGPAERVFTLVHPFGRDGDRVTVRASREDLYAFREVREVIAQAGLGPDNGCINNAVITDAATVSGLSRTDAGCLVMGILRADGYRGP